MHQKKFFWCVKYILVRKHPKYLNLMKKKKEILR